MNWGGPGPLVVNIIVNYCFACVLLCAKVLKETETEETINLLSLVAFQLRRTGPLDPPLATSIIYDVVFHIRCRFPYTMSFSIYDVVFHIRCRFPYTMSFSIYDVVFHIRCRFPYTMSFSIYDVVFHIRCRFPYTMSFFSIDLCNIRCRFPELNMARNHYSVFCRRLWEFQAEAEFFLWVLKLKVQKCFWKD